MAYNTNDPYWPDWSKSPKEWAKCWHAVDKNGGGHFFEHFPFIDSSVCDFFISKYDSDGFPLGQIKYNEQFDAFDWRNSVRRRPHDGNGS